MEKDNVFITTLSLDRLTLQKAVSIHVLNQPVNVALSKPEEYVKKPTTVLNINQEETDVLITPIHLESSLLITPKPIIEHVLEKYLAKKIAIYMGVPVANLSSEQRVRVPRNYSPSEGKIKGYWELFVKEGVLDLRIDLQPCRKQGYNSHYGDLDYCHWQVQFGASKVCKKSSKATNKCETSGTYAGVLMKTDTNFKFLDLQNAFRTSFETNQYVKLELKTININECETKLSQVETSQIRKVRFSPQETNQKEDEEENEEDEEEEEDEEVENNPMNSNRNTRNNDSEEEESEEEEEEDERPSTGKWKQGRKSQRSKHNRKSMSRVKGAFAI
eukprot:NODE_4143_length_1221_cov_31.254098_g3646_i0.p1 GENE.NODE_4143_length_1221_cov_31.254098_g3646_i0~~NODE_4143_length_1221_cov_31.254098_g3646_i0.p1  ORF type:complete len:379 (-),score=94.73 NODE_4143_length_1221_cov_31.254098_g3646_i0:83-1075(-)